MLWGGLVSDRQMDHFHAGGIRQFRLSARQDGHDLVGGFVVPVSALNTPNPAPTGRYALFAFVGDEAASPTVVNLQ